MVLLVGYLLRDAIVDPPLGFALAAERARAPSVSLLQDPDESVHEKVAETDGARVPASARGASSGPLPSSLSELPPSSVSLFAAMGILPQLRSSDFSAKMI